MGRTAFEVADVVRLGRKALEAIQSLSPEEGWALSAITLCRTEPMGGHRNLCAKCGHEEPPSYNSCRNRHCPKCQALDQERWIASRTRAILPISHYHGVFTLPEDLRAIARKYPREIYDALFRCAAEALLELAKERLGVRLGLTLVLHTWTRDLRFHPHVHVLVTAGGLSEVDGTFRHFRRKVLLHVRPLGNRFKQAFLDHLRALRDAGILDLKEGAFGALMASLVAQDWNVYLKRSFHGPENTLQYLGRYTHRIGVANSRLEDVTPDQVKYRMKDGRLLVLHPVKFLQRFVQHVLPEGFKKIRHMGLYASPKALAKAKAQLGKPPIRRECPKPTWQEALLEVTGRDVKACPKCGGVIIQKPVGLTLIKSKRARSPTARPPS